MEKLNTKEYKQIQNLKVKVCTSVIVKSDIFVLPCYHTTWIAKFHIVSLNKMEKEFTHIDADGKVKMVDVGHKMDNRREAIASARITLPQEVREKLVDNEIHGKKGPVFQTARLAGIMGAKKTHDLIPLCHPLSLSSINVDITVDDGNLEIRCSVACTGKTGVEMEALTGATIAALTVYDMCKALSHNIVIDQIKLVKKTGGKQDYDREA